MQNDYISTHLSSMVNEEQFSANLKTLHSDPDLGMIQKLKKVFDNVPQTQWENIGKKHALKKYDQFALNTTLLLLGKYHIKPLLTNKRFLLKFLSWQNASKFAIFYVHIQKPKVVFSIFHFVLLYFFK